MNLSSVVRQIKKEEEGDINLITNTVLPISHEHILSYVSQKGSIFMTDLRSRNEIVSHYDIIGP